METFLVGDPTLIGKTVVVGILAYLGLLVFLRSSGNRTLSKMNAFDLVVTVALGSTLATILLSPDVSLLRGLAALALLVALQFSITWSSVRVAWLRRLVTGEPVLLVRDGRLLEQAMRRARVTAEEIDAALRASGEDGLHGIRQVVLETDGSFSVVAGAEPSPSRDE